MATRRAPALVDADALRSKFIALNLPFMLEHHQAYAQGTQIPMLLATACAQWWFSFR